MSVRRDLGEEDVQEGNRNNGGHTLVNAAGLREDKARDVRYRSLT